MLQVVRGIGMALSGPSGVAFALAEVQRDRLPDASSQVNILSRVGGALGSALFVVLLLNGLAGTRAATVTAFHTTFWWLTGTLVVALGSAVRLLAEQRRSTRLFPRYEQHPATGKDPS